MLKQLLDTNKTLYFIFLCVTTWLLLFLKKSLLEYETAAFIVLEQDGRLGLFDALSALQFLSVPIIYLYKFTIIAFMLWIGAFMFGYKLTYKQLFGAVIVAETVFLAPEFIKIFYLLFFRGELSYLDIRAYYPLSLMDFVNHLELPDKYHYPYKALNLFEIFYWVILTYSVQILSRKRMDISAYIVGVFYVLIFLVWLWFYVNVYK